jgi:hypothetical protein
MKPPEYTEGSEALENFKRGMKALFKVPKTAVIVQAKKAKSKPVSLRKPKRADKD